MPAPRPTAQIIERPPGHARILGLPRAGKTTLLVERFHHLERAGHRPLVIAFGRDQSDRLLERLIPPGTSRFGTIPVITHGLLAGRILSAARPTRGRTLRDVDERIVLDRVLDAHGNLIRSDLRSIADSASFRDTLLEALHGLAQNGVSAEQAGKAADASRDARTRDVLSLFAAYRRYLDERDIASFYDAAWAAARALAAEPSLAASAIAGDVILIDDFHDLDAGQFELLRTLAPPGGLAALEVFGDPTGPRFSFRGTSDRFLLEEFPRMYAPVEFRLAAATCDDAALSSSVAALAGDAVPMRKHATSPALDSLPLFAANATGDIAAAPLLDDGIAAAPWRVSACAVRPLDEMAEAHYAAARVDSWRRDGVPGDEIAVIARDAQRVASLYYQVFRERGVPLATGARADTATHAFLHALAGALGRDADGRFVEALASSPLLRVLCGRLNAPTRDIARVLSGIHSTHSTKEGLDFARLLTDAMDDYPAGAAAVSAVIDDWHRYVEIAERAGGNISIDEFRRAYLDAQPREAAHAGIPRLVSAHEISGHTVRAAVVVGCAEGIFPRRTPDNGYISMAALGAALEGIHEDAAREFARRADRDTLEHGENALLLSALCAASETVVLSCPLRSANEHLDPAPVLASLFADAEQPTRDQSVASRSALAVAPRPEGDALGARMRAIDSLAQAWLGALPVKKHPVLPGCRLSPSGIDGFTRCARLYFYTKVLKVDEPGSIYLDIGSIFHGVMQRVVPVGASNDEVRALLGTGDFSAAIDEAIAEDMDNESPWLKDLTRVHMRNMVRRAAGLEAQRIRPYTVRTVEKMLELKVGDEVVLSGQVDRIDDVEGLGSVVVDYKTGKMNKTAATLIEELEEKGKHWQVPVYAALASTEGPRPVAFLFYVMKDDAHVVGMQTVDGVLPPPITDRGKSKSPYGRIASATVDAKLEQALALRAALVAGEQAFDRTDKTDSCRRCHFVHVCRRSHV
jgi:hypothetical protein